MWGESIGTGSGVRFTVWKRGSAALANALPNRTIFIEKLTEVRRTIEQLLTQLQASEHDKFVAHLYQARKQYRLVCERPNKSNKAIERRCFQATRSRRAWDLTATFEVGSICCGFGGDQRPGLRRRGWRSPAGR